MTDKTETALDLDGLAASGFTEGPWLIGDAHDARTPRYWIVQNLDTWVNTVAAVPDYEHLNSLADCELIAAAPSLLSLALSQRDRIRELENRLHPTHISMDDDFYTQSDNVADAMDGVFDAAGPHKIYRAVTIGLPSTYGCWINGHAVEFKTEDEAKKALKETS